MPLHVLCGSGRSLQAHGAAAQQCPLAQASPIRPAAARFSCGANQRLAAFPGQQHPSLCSSSQPPAAWCAGRRTSVVVKGRANSSLNLPLDLDLETPLPGFDSIASALADLAAGKVVVVLDDEDRENEGDLIMNADKVTTEAMAFFVEYTSGVVCISMEGKDLDRLRLPLMVSSAENEEAMYTAFTITVDLKDGISTGISASDRAKTISRMADPSAVAADFRRPGHIFPLRYRPGGVLVRPGHTEAAVDLARLSGSFPAGVLCEIVNKEDGSMARTPDLLKFAKQHGLKCITIADLIRYRLRHDTLVTSAAPPAALPVRAGTSTSAANGAPLKVHAFRSAIDGVEHLAVAHGSLDAAQPVLLHVHHERTVADLLDCGAPSPSPSLESALTAVSHAAGGVLLYMRSGAARGVQPSQELQQLAAAGGRPQPLPLELKDAATMAAMLNSLGVKEVALAGGDEQLAAALRSCGVSVQLAAPGDVAVSAGGGISGNGHVVSNGKPLAGAGIR